MKKKDEISKKESCFNKAKLDEYMFILLERDITTPTVIRFWVSERIRLSKNTENDKQIREALDLADSIEDQRKIHASID